MYFTVFLNKDDDDDDDNDDARHIFVMPPYTSPYQYLRYVIKVQMGVTLKSSQKIVL